MLIEFFNFKILSIFFIFCLFFLEKKINNVFSCNIDVYNVIKELRKFFLSYVE